MICVPKTKLINFMDTPVVVQYNQNGNAAVPFSTAFPIGQISVKKFRQVSVCINSTTATSCELSMGKISGHTRAQAFVVPLDNKIHTFDIIGPEMALILDGGPPNSTDNVELWVYLRA